MQHASHALLVLDAGRFHLLDCLVEDMLADAGRVDPGGSSTTAPVVPRGTAADERGGWSRGVRGGRGLMVPAGVKGPGGAEGAAVFVAGRGVGSIVGCKFR